MSKNMTNEFLISYMEDFNDYNKIIELSCKHWNNIAKNQFKRKVKYLEDVQEDKRKKTRKFEVAFQNGSKAYFLFIPKKINTFDLHTELRESFLEGVKEHDNLSFNISNVGVEHQLILVSALSSLVHLCQWKYPKFGKQAKNGKKEKKDFGFYSGLDGDTISELLINGELIAEGTNLVRTLASMPTNYMTSKDLTNEARQVARRLRGVNFEFLNENKLKEMNAGAFLSVIRGTKGSNGGIAHLSYKTKVEGAQKIAIIGKGVVFDTGGYSIKTDGSMKDMHRDMTGAAVGLALFQSLVKSKIKANLDLYIAIGENLVSEASYKPNEVVMAMDGTAIEIVDTDAEGRMLLADTILYAKQQNPDILLDFATLTGDAVGAIDTRYSCVFSNQYDIGLKSVAIGQKCGERVWNFPTDPDFSETLKSDIADLSQCTSSDNAEQIYAACFLQHFAGQTPWIHVDLSSEYCSDGLGLVDTDVTGFGVRWGFEFIKQYLKDKEIYE